MRAIAPPMAYHADTLAIFVPYAAFVVSLGCATVLTSVPPSPLDARACRALQCHPRHVPRPHRTPRSFLIAGAAFVAFSYVATTISFPHHTARVAGRIPKMTLTSPAPVAAARPRTPRSPSQPSAQNLLPARTTDTTCTPCTPPTHALDRLQRRPTVCSEADATSQREYDAHHHHRTQQHALQLFPITHATFVLSPRAYSPSAV
jgi:hypothetical protein